MSEGVARIQLRDLSMMKFMPKPNTFFVEGHEVKCSFMSGDPFTTQKFGTSHGLFAGWTYFDEDGNRLEEKRFVEENLPMSDFDVTIRGKRINDMTYLELVALL